ncbi:amidohydrolase family protein [Neobacillus mesonae]|uniref:amidohydrolase family protein n=1 Tax=Neobacillus mesonae TaxID=1193713 RepID=UPI00203F8781|nr:amidohydrolase family protein [Neobacillus mesonae]MCM3569026.1 amidohydrolase [Neobacillus mesonae]
METVLKENEVNQKVEKGLIDCDVHPYLADFNELIPYLEEGIQKHMNIGRFEKSMLSNMNAGAFTFPKARYANPNHVLRLDAITPEGGVPGSDPVFTAQDLLDKHQHTYGILNIGHGTMAGYHNVEIAAGYTSGSNDWLYDRWVLSDPRFKMTMSVTPVAPDLAIEEIKRIGHKPGIVGINLQCINIPLGKRHFWPLYEIAQEYNLPIVLHPDCEGTAEYAPPNAVGPASTYAEWHTSLSLIAQRQIASLVCEGVFEKFPNLKFNFIEYGFSWLPSLMWRLDKNWKALRSEMPWVKKLPSEYIRSNVRLGTQPIEESFHPKDIVQLIQMVKAEDMLLFASDYPHWDGDERDSAFLHFPDDLKQKIFYDNAKNSYRL